MLNNLKYQKFEREIRQVYDIPAWLIHKAIDIEYRALLDDLGGFRRKKPQKALEDALDNARRWIREPIDQQSLTAETILLYRPSRLFFGLLYLHRKPEVKANEN